jgi:hypothetical protein
MKLFVSWECFHHEIYIKIFTSTFQQIRISPRCHTEIHVALKYSEPCRTTLLSNCYWQQMTNGADNCCLLLTNHKQTLTHEPHWLLWNIMPLVSVQVKLLPFIPNVITDSSAKFICASQQEAHQLPWSAELWTCQLTKNPPSNTLIVWIDICKLPSWTLCSCHISFLSFVCHSVEWGNSEWCGNICMHSSKAVFLSWVTTHQWWKNRIRSNRKYFIWLNQTAFGQLNQMSWKLKFTCVSRKLMEARD